jgi:hypothetical protein
MGRRSRGLFCFTLLSFLGGAPSFSADSKPDFESAHGLVHFEWDRPEEVVLTDPIRGPDAYWLLPYRLINRTEKERDLVLRMVAEFDVQDIEDRKDREASTRADPLARGDPYAASGVRHAAVDQPAARKRLEEKTRRAYLDHSGMQGLLRPQQVKEGAAVFPPMPRSAGKVVVYVDGLSPGRVRLRRGEDYVRMVYDLGFELRKVVPHPISGREDFAGLLAPIDRYAYAQRKDELLKAQQLPRRLLKRSGRLHEGASELYFDLADPLFDFPNLQRFRERWIYVMHFSRSGGESRADEQSIRFSDGYWFLAVERLADK